MPDKTGAGPRQTRRKLRSQRIRAVFIPPAHTAPKAPLFSMLFNSLTFLVFATLFFPIYFALHGRARLWFMLLSSYLFYGWWDWRFLALLGFSTTVDYTLGRLLEFERDPRRRRALLIVSIVVNLGILGFFK